MANNDKFRASFKRRIEKSKTKTDLFVKALLVEIDSRLTEKSPVGDPDSWKSKAPEGYVGGRFKANWVVGDGYINASTSDSVTPSDNRAVINSIKINGQTISITNSLPYAYRLENGYSQKAPQGMVKVTLAELNGILTKTALHIRSL